MDEYYCLVSSELLCCCYGAACCRHSEQQWQSSSVQRSVILWSAALLSAFQELFIRILWLKTGKDVHRTQSRWNSWPEINRPMHVRGSRGGMALLLRVGFEARRCTSGCLQKCLSHNCRRFFFFALIYRGVVETVFV